MGFCVKFGSRRTNHSAEKRTNQATGTKLVVNASSLLLATARARCVFVHVAVSVRLPSPRALRRNDYIYQSVALACAPCASWRHGFGIGDVLVVVDILQLWFFCEIGFVFARARFTKYLTSTRALRRCRYAYIYRASLCDEVGVRVCSCTF